MDAIDKILRVIQAYWLVGCLFCIPLLLEEHRKPAGHMSLSKTTLFLTILFWPLVIFIYVDTILWKLRKTFRKRQWKKKRKCSHLWQYATYKGADLATCLYCGETELLENES